MERERRDAGHPDIRYLESAADSTRTRPRARVDYRCWSLLRRGCAAVGVKMSRSVLRRSWVLLAPVCLPVLAGTDALSDGLRRCAHDTDQAHTPPGFHTLAGSAPQG